MKNSDESAFPAQYLNEQRSSVAGYSVYDTSPGLTKREYFAAMAMQGLLANMASDGYIRVNDWGVDSSKIAELSTDAADALLSELNQPTKK